MTPYRKWLSLLLVFGDGFKLAWEKQKVLGRVRAIGRWKCGPKQPNKLLPLSADKNKNLRVGLTKIVRLPQKQISASDDLGYLPLLDIRGTFCKYLIH